VANERSMKWAKWASGILTSVYKLLTPLTRLLVKSTYFVNRVVTKKHENISTDELSQALEISDVKSSQDKEMLEGILSFGEKEVSDIMISRVDVTDIEYHASWESVLETIRTTGYSRIPVYDTTQDAIKGVLYSKDLLPYIDRTDSNFAWQRFVRDAYFVPESRMIDDLLEDFRRKKIHIAIVVDEFGGTQGIVTLEDIIEEIMGDIEDEYDDSKKFYTRLDPDTYIFEGKTPLADFCRITGVDEDELGDIDEVETLAGLILTLKGDFPKDKEAFVLGRLRFLVLEVERRRITAIRVHILPQ
jgi:gliding motility-associated protein GldE